ncbi:Cu-Zn superoxide dismutase, variant [Blastomyces dermatitidis ER-3]|uniref:Cu-Zn superoxide dismutase n=1 Tax=Ajellomyces dermatitidis (strain ER-3 / ATCC MYA-2586) TaxID=559297 RepID=A0ABX2W0D0_AJEDR|nr:Cu-Zn superoxide dismutase [Blastomyces dermatitidis ER-3]XP_045282569.1 Cu-Zn superoxide dismutase, variant [Blastomyces dermatitidis ER-3]OAT02841.1 Cu-Zn superoxide dismutase [Blastomyces dermatitidis ER-3]OAT02842.1 Cu-Zn superoxide dismutase, variant [Blastomyces dermatitidis ER-3]
MKAIAPAFTMRASSALLAYSALSFGLTTAQFIEAPETYHNPYGVVYSAMLLDKNTTSLRGTINATAGPGGHGVVYTLEFWGFPEESKHGPFPYHVHDQPVNSSGDCLSTLAHLDLTFRGEYPPCDKRKPWTCQAGDFSGNNITRINCGNFSLISNGTTPPTHTKKPPHILPPTHTKKPPHILPPTHTKKPPHILPPTHTKKPPHIVPPTHSVPHPKPPAHTIPPPVAPSHIYPPSAPYPSAPSIPVYPPGPNPSPGPSPPPGPVVPLGTSYSPRPTTPPGSGVLPTTSGAPGLPPQSPPPAIGAANRVGAVSVGMVLAGLAVLML